jgi:V/A-type H+-transporting ATPase subunit K
MRTVSWKCSTVFFVAFAAALLCGPSVSVLMAAEGPQGEQSAGVSQTRDWAMPLAIALSIGLSCAAAGYAVAKVGASALGAASENPELLTRSLLFVALAEGIAIYGLLIAILLWIKL